METHAPQAEHWAANLWLDVLIAGWRLFWVVLITSIAMARGFPVSGVWL